jgi:putative toxin-antitoxin system antitoxin component (TIGR02293 family)
MSNLGIPIEGAPEAIRHIERGLPFSALERLAHTLGVDRTRIAQALGIPERTLARRKTAGRLSPDETEKLIRVSGLFDRAIDLFEDDSKAAARWFTTPRKEFNDQAPLEFARWDPGAREVEAVIARLEHGVF